MVATRKPRYVRRGFVALLTLAALTVLVTGVVSYWHGVPENSIWIDMEGDTPQVYVAMIDGVLHGVVATDYTGTSRTDIEHRLGPFYARQTSLSDKILGTGAGVPFWGLFPLLALVPSVAFVRGPWRRRRRRRRGLCIGCGYSLRGLDDARCPECSRPFDPEKLPNTV